MSRKNIEMNSFPQAAGLYVHIPFCIHKCPYCDFFSITDRSLIPAFIEALEREMAMTATFPLPFDSLYIGGGTPSVLEANQVARVMETVCRAYEILPGTEVTIEANPGTLRLDKLLGFKSAGINRLNIGVQSFQDVHLNFLGRIHKGEDAESAIKNARKAGFDNLGLDLIYGIPRQTKKSWFLDLQRAVDYAPEHLSCYMLSYEPGTPMESGLRKGLFLPMPEDLAGDLFEATSAFLSSHGYQHYEISNFARSTDLRSGHNMKYWSGGPYLGLGPSAHSFLGTKRSWNCRCVKQYMEDLDSGRLPKAGEETLGRDQEMIEAVYLGLRKADGIAVDVFDLKFGVRFHNFFGEVLDDLQKNGLMKVAESRCALTCRGMRFLDSIASLFVERIG
jgi:oxygen-independent coproporphyrinogen-3 oxidase